MRKFGLLLIIVFLTTQLFAWGKLGHEVITRFAIEGLPDEMIFFKENIEYLVEHSIDPDLRKSEDPAERNKHFIDIDYYEDFNVGKMITDKTELIEKYGENMVDKMGILPWNTVAVIESLTEAMKNEEQNEILFYAADLAHYVADAHQPQHNILNYNGRKTDQYGIHGRYEINLINDNLEELQENISAVKLVYVENPLSFIFDFCTQANSFAGMIELADLHSLKYSDNDYNEEYFRIFWYRTKYMTFHQFSNAAEDLASLYYTVCVNAGKPALK